MISRSSRASGFRFDDEREGKLAELALAVVDQRVVGDDPRAQAHIALGQAARRLSDGGVDQLAHVGDDASQVRQLIGEHRVIRVQQWLAHIHRTLLSLREHHHIAPAP